MLNKILLFPFGGNAREALGAISAINKLAPEWDVIGFVDDNPALVGQAESGVAVLGGRDIFQKYPEARVLAVNGSPNSFGDRQRVIDSLEIPQERFATIIHPGAVLSRQAQIGYNSLIMAHVVVSCGVTLGNHCIVLPNTTIGHDAKIHAATCIGANVVISGNVEVGASCYIASGACIRDNIKIGDQSLVGLGAVVVADVNAGIVVAGNPAKETGSHKT